MAYLELLQEFSFGQNIRIIELVAFQLQKCHAEDRKSVNQSVFDLVATLIKHDVFKLEDIWHYIATGDQDELEELAKEQLADINYQYKLLFTTIMNEERFEKEMES